MNSQSLNHLAEPVAKGPNPTRRGFLQTCAAALVAAGTGPLPVFGAAPAPAPGRQVPLKLGLRAVSLKMVGDFGVIQTAAGIPGIRGVE